MATAAPWLPRRWQILLAAALVLLLPLGRAELWTQEGRWALICAEMQRSGDLLHPSLLGSPYYGKPLLSYWLMLLTAAATGALDEFALRLPSALAGLFAIAATMHVARTRHGEATARLAGLLLGSSLCFVDWARVASADMLNTAGMLAAMLALRTLMTRPTTTRAVFVGMVLAVASLAKGPAAAVLAMLATATELRAAAPWRQLGWVRLGAAALPGAALFLLPHLLVQATASGPQSTNALWTVFRENVVRYLAPFDHRAPFYSYFWLLPVFLLPWTLWWPQCLAARLRHWRSLPTASRASLWGALLPFLFLLGCGSRRSYYLLPLVPLACLGLADWLAGAPHRLRLVRAIALGCWLAMLGWHWFGQPTLADDPSSRRSFAAALQREAAAIAPWPTWRVLSADAVPAAAFYLRAAAEPRELLPERFAELPALLAREPHTVILSRRKHQEALAPLLPAAGFREPPPPRWLAWLRELGIEALVDKFAGDRSDQVIAWLPAR